MWDAPQALPPRLREPVALRYLMELRYKEVGEALGCNPKTAEAIFYCNTVLFPNSANVYDSYGEALVANGKNQEAVKAYRKAVEIGKSDNDPNLGLFEENLKKVEAKAGKRP